jgi:autotransporter-associated beta strand protein
MVTSSKVGKRLAASPGRPAILSASIITLFAALTAGPVSAQQNIVYTNGENNSAPITITAATNPTTLAIFGLASATQSGAISDAGTTGNLIINAIDSTLTLSGINTYTGTTTIEGGTLVVGADNNLGAGQGGIILSTQSVAGAELLTGNAGDFMTSRTVSVENGVLAAVNGTTATYNGAISGFDLTFGDTQNGGAVTVNGISRVLSPSPRALSNRARESSIRMRSLVLPLVGLAVAAPMAGAAPVTFVDTSTTDASAAGRPASVPVT